MAAKKARKPLTKTRTTKAPARAAKEARAKTRDSARSGGGLARDEPEPPEVEAEDRSESERSGGGLARDEPEPPEAVVQAVLKRRKTLTDFEDLLAPHSVNQDLLAKARKSYAMAEHPGRKWKNSWFKTSGVTTFLAEITEPARQVDVFEELASEFQGQSTDFLVAQSILDGYETARQLTGEAARKKPRIIGSYNAVVRLAKGWAQRYALAEDGPLTPYAKPLYQDFVKKLGKGKKSPWAGFVIGAMLHGYEYGLEYPVLEQLEAPPKPKGAAIPRGKASNDDLLNAILAKPDDDAPRLVYADYLTSNGDARGEFIQLQCTLGNVVYGAGKSSSDPTKPIVNAPELTKRAETLLKHSRGAWLEDTKLKFVDWSRGFPLHGDSEASEFIENPRYDRMPLEGISLHWDKKSVEAIFKRQKHPTIWRFELGVGFGPKVLQIITAPVFANARNFSLRCWEPGPMVPQALEALSRASFPDLEEFEGPAEMLGALGRAQCPKLCSFRVDRDPNLEPAAATDVWRQLRRIEIRVNRAVGWNALKTATSLEVVKFWRPDELTMEDAQALVDAPPPSLKTLIGDFILEPTHYANGGYSNAVVDKNVVAILEKRFTLKPNNESPVI